jgi:exosortase
MPFIYHDVICQFIFPFTGPLDRSPVVNAPVISMPPSFAQTGYAWASGLARHWFLALAVLLFVTPGIFLLMEKSWSLEQGSHGPIILFSGLWLLVRELRLTQKRQASGRRVALLLVPILLLYVVSQTVGILWLTWIATYGALLIVLYSYVGGAALGRLWFPLAYLLCTIPPPYWLIGPLTRVLIRALSVAAVDILWILGFDVARSGVDIYIDQYELRMADACAGMNSLVSLFAIGLFYVYLRHRADWRYGILVALFVPPIAVAANLIRILMLMMIAHYLGDAAAQGYMHQTSGLIMFAAALLTLIGVDAALAPIRRRLARP